MRSIEHGQQTLIEARWPSSGPSRSNSSGVAWSARSCSGRPRPVRVGDQIVAVTSNRAIQAFIEEGVTEVVDAGGRLMIPGFNDAHAHYAGLDPDYIELRYITDPNIITEKVREAVARAQPGELIRGGHWEHEMFDDKQWPTKELLDEVAPNNPVSLSRADGHSSLVNSYVLRASGITNDTPDPPGGEIQRNPETGEATDADAVYTGFGTPEQKAIASAHPDALLELSEHFAKGSMLPKVQAAANFASSTPGKRAAIGGLTDIDEMLKGEAGTIISTEFDGVTYR